MNRTLISFIVALAVLLMVLNSRQYLKPDNQFPGAKEASKPQQHELNTEEWKELSRPELHFSIMLPSKFHHSSDRSRDPRTKELLVYDTFVAADEEGQGYMVNVITFPKTFETKEITATLKNIVTDIISRNSENKLISLKEGQFQTYKAYDFSYNNGDRRIHGKVFTVNDTVYMLGVIDTYQEHDTKEFDYFINSFKFINPPATK